MNNIEWIWNSNSSGWNGIRLLENSKLRLSSMSKLRELVLVG